MERVRVGIIGCGGIGRHHARYLREISGAEIAAVADINDNLLKSYAEEFKVGKAYCDYGEMLSSEEIEVALICLPTALHHKATIQAAEKQINVFCEKPLARTLAQGREMIEACQENGVTLQVGQVRRFDNCWGRAKEIVASRVLGQPLIWRDVKASFGPGHLPWFFDRDNGGGPFLDGMIHNFDYAHYMFGKPVKVVSGMTRLKTSTALDTGSVWVEYESGNIMSNFWSWGLAEKVSPLSGMDLIGPDGVLMFPGTFEVNEFRSHFHPEKEGLYLLKKGDGTTEPLVYQKNDMFLEQMVHLVDCLTNKKPPKVTGEEGLLALKVALMVLGEEERKRG